MFSPMTLAALNSGGMSEGALAGGMSAMSDSAPRQWWRELGDGYGKYLDTLRALGANPMAPAPKRSPQSAGAPGPIDPRALKPRNPNVITFGGGR